MHIYSIGHVAICVDDLEQAVQFYGQLGLDLSYKTADMAYLYSGNQGIALMRSGSAQAKPHFGFACTSRQDVEQRHRELTLQGLSVTPVQVMGEVAAFYVQDPSGNWFEYLFEPESTEMTSKPVLKGRDRARSSRSKGFG